MYRILFLWHKLGNGAGRTVGNGVGSTVWEERRGSTVREELDVPKEWLRESDNFRKFVLKIFWGHEL